jgi:predicted RNA-binding protein YlxR (DUF448 family)
MRSLVAKEKSRRRRHVPQRTCVVCRAVKPKRELTRVVRTADQGVQIDPTGKRAGRGAYLCDSPACWEKASTTDVLSRALRTTLSEEERARLRQAAPQPKAV